MKLGALLVPDTVAPVFPFMSGLNQRIAPDVLKKLRLDVTLPIFESTSLQFAARISQAIDEDRITPLLRRTP